MGTQMIREIGKELKKELPMLEKFSSLSPIPGFRDYLLSQIQSMVRGENNPVVNFLTPAEEGKVRQYLVQKKSNVNNFWPILQEMLRQNAWINDPQLEELLRQPLMRKCAHYLYNEKRRGYALNAVGKLKIG